MPRQWSKSRKFQDIPWAPLHSCQALYGPHQLRHTTHFTHVMNFVCLPKKRKIVLNRASLASPTSPHSTTSFYAQLASHKQKFGLYPPLLPPRISLTVPSKAGDEDSFVVVASSTRPSLSFSFSTSQSLDLAHALLQSTNVSNGPLSNLSTAV